MELAKLVKYFFFSFFILSTPQIFEKFPKITEILSFETTLMGIKIAHVVFATIIIILIEMVTEK